MQHSGSFYWRQTVRRPSFLWIFDFSASIGFLVFALHMRDWTFYLALLLTLVLSIISHFGFTTSVLIRRAFFLLAGRSRPPRDWYHWERLGGSE